MFYACLYIRYIYYAKTLKTKTRHKFEMEGRDFPGAIHAKKLLIDDELEEPSSQTHYFGASPSITYYIVFP